MLVLTASLLAAGMINPHMIVGKNSSLGEIRSGLFGLLQVVATIGSLSIATAFITAQLSGIGARAQRLRILYRSNVILTSVVLTALCCGLGAWVASGYVTNTQLSLRVIAAITLLGMLEIALLVPTVLLQFEWFVPEYVMRTVCRGLTGARAREYGLTSVRQTGEGKVEYSLMLYGIKSRSVDPLRPVHEVLFDAVRQRDRVLYAQLIREIAVRLGEVHGSAVSRSPWQRSRADQIRQKWLKINGSDALTDRVHLTLMCCHYLVKRAGLITREWEGRDTGRHGTTTALVDLLHALSADRKNQDSIRIVLWALIHIGSVFRTIQPYGRIEPLNAIFELPPLLKNAGMGDEAQLCAGLLYWTQQTTEQLSPNRAPSVLWDKLVEDGYSPANIELSELINRFDDPWKDPRALGMGKEHVPLCEILEEIKEVDDCCLAEIEDHAQESDRSRVCFIYNRMKGRIVAMLGKRYSDDGGDR